MSSSRAKSGESEALAAAIEIACRGLIYTSETDAPIEPFLMHLADGEDFPDAAEHLKKQFPGGCIEADFDEFFARLTADREWHTPLQQRAVKKFRKLRDLLRSELKDLKVYRFGGIRIDIVVAGRVADGDLLGIKTRAVET